MFELFPRRTRLRVLSVINNRWRATALGTITSLEGLRSERAFDVLPNPHLSVSTGMTLWAAPSTLRSLAILIDQEDRCGLGRGPCLCAPYLNSAGPTSLRSDLNTTTRNCGSFYVLARHSQSLRSVTVRAFRNVLYEDGIDHLTRALRLPSLTELDSSLAYSNLTQLLLNHASQLRALRLDRCYWHDVPHSATVT